MNMKPLASRMKMFRSRVDKSEELWRKDQDERGWKLPPPAAYPLRLPIIRRFRAAWIAIQAERQAGMFALAGIGLGRVNEYDRWVIYAIHRGWC